MVKKVCKVRDLDKRKDLDFVSADFEVESIKDFFGKDADDYEAFFVKASDGDYDEVWGIESNIPRLDLTAYRVK